MRYDEQWYDSLIKPPFQPPKWIFAPVWSILYLMMFSALIVILLQEFSFKVFLALLLFSCQFYFNIIWTPAFFKEHNLRKAFLISVALAVFVFLTMVVFLYVSRIAGFLFIPYFLWCCFASVLSFEILELNEW